MGQDTADAVVMRFPHSIALAGLPLPESDTAVAEAAEAAGLTIPAPCLPGVMANIALLRGHAETLLTPPDTRRA